MDFCQSTILSMARHYLGNQLSYDRPIREPLSDPYMLDNQSIPRCDFQGNWRLRRPSLVLYHIPSTEVDMCWTREPMRHIPTYRYVRVFSWRYICSRCWVAGRLASVITYLLDCYDSPDRMTESGRISNNVSLPFMNHQYYCIAYCRPAGHQASCNWR